MRSVQVTRLDGPGAVEVRESDYPRAEGSEVVVDIRAAGVNFPDLLMTRGEYQLRRDTPFVLGFEFAGVVIEAPPSSGLLPGARVAGIGARGTFAERAAVSPNTLFEISPDMEFEVAAAMPMNYLTAHFTLWVRAGLRAGETVLIHGAAGGIGTAAVQVAVAGGATVIAVSSTDAKAEVARSAGAHHVVSASNFRAETAAIVGAAGVDVVVDPVGGERFLDSLRVLNPTGRLMVVGFTSGEIPTVRVNRLLLNNIDVRGVAWGAYALSTPGYVRWQWEQLSPHVDSGCIRPVVGAVHGLDDAAVALSALDNRSSVGKVVLAI